MKLYIFSLALAGTVLPETSTSLLVSGSVILEYVSLSRHFGTFFFSVLLIIATFFFFGVVWLSASQTFLY
jgi:hypothetical protein